ncbi:MAG TPA: SpoVG family protein [Verrucomicrobiae bacterium]|jgi:stage V sporulation protein G|nr:SpoVG family protein [Verrucomicrobiae bacterium]
MKITEVRVFPRKDGDKKLKAFVTITLDECFVIRDLKVIEGSKGLFVAMPSRKVEKRGDGELGDFGRVDHRDIAHPITSECREYIQKSVLDAYYSLQGTSEEAAARR